MSDIDRDESALRLFIEVYAGRAMDPVLAKAALDRLVTAARAKEAAEARVEALKGALREAVEKAERQRDEARALNDCGEIAAKDCTLHRKAGVYCRTHLATIAQIEMTGRENAETAREVAMGALRNASKIAEAMPELNPSNYDHDQVGDLNSRAIELVLFLRAALSGKEER